jgi:alpha-galactosidase
MFKKDFGFFVDEKYSNNFSVALSSSNNGINVYKINLHFDIPTSVKDLKICYFKPMRGMLSIWHSSAPRNRALRQWFDKNSVRSNFYLGAPLVSVVDGEKNYCTIALSDAQTPCELNAFVDDFADNEEICYDLILFKGIDKLISDYSIFVRIDEQDKPYFKAISSVKNWWDTFYPPIIDNCDSAEDALYSSWYNFHQHPK